MGLATFEVDAPMGALEAALEKDGGFIVRDLLTPEQIARLNAEIDPELARARAGTNANPQFSDLSADFHGERTKRVSRLLAFSPTFPEVLDHPFIDTALELTLLRHWGNYWLGTAQVMDVGPGEKAQALHRDLFVYPTFLPQGPAAPTVIINFIIALNDFTGENGATRVIPGSNRWPDYGDYGSPEQTIPAEMRAGSALFTAGNVLHGAGANRTDVSRRAIAITFNVGYLTPEEAHPFEIPAEIARKLSPKIQQMIGYRSFYEKGQGGLWTVDFDELADYLKLDD